MARNKDRKNARLNRYLARDAEESKLLYTVLHAKIICLIEYLQKVKESDDTPAKLRPPLV